MRAFLTAALVCLLGANISAQDSGSQRKFSTFEIKSTSGKIDIDGDLEDPGWRNATRISLKYETRPGENTPATVPTEALIAYDAGSLYVAFIATDPRPEEIRARYTDRDNAFDDDFVGVVLDTFNDERRAYEFFVNPLGVQMDLLMDDVGGSEDSTWDAIWNTAGKLTDTGFTVEMEIPFSSIRFPDNATSQTWGIDVLRFVPRNQRVRIASQPLLRSVSCYLCQASKITGLTGIKPGANLEFDPTLTAHSSDNRNDFPSGDFERDSELDPGVSVSWGITPNWTLNGTVNPDFSQVEADAAQLDINTQFALFFPEKRPFFLEAADFFSTGLNAVFTRNVADPITGIKLTGKSGSNVGGFFSAYDQITNLILPGSQSSSSIFLDRESLDSVARYRRDIGSSSAIGLLVTDREANDYFNRVFGADGTLRFGSADVLRFQALGSSTRYPDEVVASENLNKDSFTDYGLQLKYNHDARNWFWYGTYENIGTDFRADMGFMPRVDYRFYLGGMGHTWQGTNENWYTRMQVGADYDETEDQTGELIEREVEAWYEVSGPKQSFFFIGPGWRKRRFEDKEFDQHFVNYHFEFTPNKNIFVQVVAKSGNELDVVNARNGDLFRFIPALTYKMGRHLLFQLDHTFERLDVEDGQRLFRANLSQFKAVYQFNVRTFVRAILQYTDVDRDPSLYRIDVNERDKDLFTQFLFSYKINPQTVLFLGYSDNYVGENTIDLTQTNRTVFFKVGYAWQM